MPSQISVGRHEYMGVVDKVKELAVLAQKVQSVELYERLVSFQSEILALQNENRDLLDQVRGLKERLDLRARMIWRRPSYWTEDGETLDGPFCQRCYDVEGKLVRLQGGDNDLWYCCQCKNQIAGAEYKPPPPKRASSSGFLNGLPGLDR
jgi:hypothetical protein